MSSRISLLQLGFVLLLGAGQLPAQSISDFNPKYGSPGDQVVITGSGYLTGTIRVYFYNNVQANIFINSDTQLTVTNVPNGVATGPISVQRNSQMPVSSLANFTVVGIGPYITGFSPAFGSTNTLVSIYGVHFQKTSAVKFNGATAMFWLPFTGGTQLNTYVPPAAPLGTNTISVTMTNIGGSVYGTSNAPGLFTMIGRGPYVTNFSPYFGSDHEHVIVKGLQFLPSQGNPTNVTFNGKPGTGFFVNSETQLEVYAPTGVTTGPLVVLSGLGPSYNFTTSSNFYALPVITSFSPANGRAYTNLTIRGTNFTDATSVKFSSSGGPFTLSVAPTSVTSNTVQVTVPPGVTTGLIRVDTPANSPALSSSNFVVRPTLSGFSPVAGRPGTNVTITGANLNAGGLTVKFGTLQAQTNNVSFSQATAVVPVGATNATITITTVDGTDTSSQIFYLPPSISSFTPNASPPGSMVTISGLNLLGAPNVYFNGTPAAAIVATNNTTLRAWVPDGVSTGPIAVTTPAGTTNSGNSLFYGAPVISNFNPAHGFPGNNVTISGNNLLGATSVSFNGAAASFTPPTTNTVLQAKVPTNAVTGPITVVAPAGSVTSSVAFVVDFTNDLAVTVVAAPDPVFVGSNLTYTIVVINKGPSDAPNVILTNGLPGSVILQSASTTAGSLNTNGNPILGALGTLTNSTSATITLVVVPQLVGTITNSATVTGVYPDPVPADNLSIVTTTVYPLPSLSIQLYSPMQVLIRWPAVLTNFVLQSKNDLSPNSAWSTVPFPPLTIGTDKAVIDTVGSTPTFYRLKR